MADHDTTPPPALPEGASGHDRLLHARRLLADAERMTARHAQRHGGARGRRVRTHFELALAELEKGSRK